MRYLSLSVGFLIVVLAIGCGDTATGNDSADPGAGDPDTVAGTDGADGDTVAPGDSVAAGLSLLNERRVAAGAPPVEPDPGLTKGCLEHVRYMAATQSLVHEQDKSSPYWSKAGQAAGENGNIAANVGGLHVAVELWLWSIYNRLTLLDPGTSTVGGAFEYGYACLDPISGWTADTEHAPVPYPFHGQKKVPTTYENLGALDPIPAEIEKPTGPIVSLLFPPGVVLDPAFSAVLSVEDGGTIIETFTRLPKDESDPYAAFQRNAVTLIPVAPLQPGTTYRVIMSGSVNEELYEKQWVFSTD